MLIRIPRIVNLYLFPPGRAIHAMERVIAAASAIGLAEIAERAGRARDHFRVVYTMQRRHRAGRTGLYGEDTVLLDNLTDRALSGVDIHLEAQQRLFPEDHERHAAAATLRQALFPEGVRAITGQSYVQQRVAVDEMLADYGEPELAGARAALPELDTMMARVAELNQQYGESIDAYDRDRPSGEELRQAQELGQTHLAETAVLILAAYVRAAPEGRAALAGMLEHILRQNEAIRATRKRRRSAQDIDPDTGADLPDSDLPAPELPVEPPAEDAPAELSS